MSGQTREKLIEAGAIVPDPGGDRPDTADAVTARTYRHPALDDRVVVRLVPETLGGAEDLALEFLGFGAAAEPVAVGVGQRRALGFPAWALINDPANGHHALALVKDVERLARLARSRPGAAKEGFDELAQRLGAAVPHFLPTYYEQAGRAFLAVDNRPAAAIMFGKAREAERVYALPIDEDRQRDVFLEFAFSGALNAKSLTQYAKDLSGRTDPRAAYELFRQVCAERVAGGLPPYAGMADDLRRLARAAKLSQADEEERTVAGLLESPALPHAPLAFWRSYAPALKRLAAKDVSVRSRLLGLFPRAESGDTEDFWLDLLEDTGATAGLTASEPDPAARPADGASGWLVRAAAWRSRGWRQRGRSARFLDLVRSMADRLRAEGQPLRLVGSGYQHSLDLDLLDLVLALGLTVGPPDDGPVRPFPLARWRHDDSPGRRDLAALAAVDWAREPFRAGLDAAMRERGGFRPERDGRVPLSYLEVFYRTRGTRQALADWLAEAARESGEGTLPGLEDTLGRVRPVAHGEVFGVRPSAHAGLTELDVAGALARTLRIGLLDEFGWPALEEAVAEFPEPDPKRRRADHFEVTAAWPYLILHNAAQAVVVGPRAVVLRHTLRWPANRPDWRSKQIALVDGRLRVLWEDDSGWSGYWSDRPGEIFTGGGGLPYHHRLNGFGASQPLPDGGRTYGGRALSVGDRTPVESRDVVSDGSGWWHLDVKDWATQHWHEFDPVTGDTGRVSRPGFFEAGLTADGARPADYFCFLAPVPDGLEGSPFGTAGGLLGWRSVLLADGSGEAVSVGGASARVRAGLLPERAVVVRGPVPVGPIRLPGAGVPAALLVGSGGEEIGFTDGEARGARVRVVDRAHESPYARGTDYVPPLPFWHALRARDERGSAVLRSITPGQARQLLERGAGGPKKATAAVRRVLPQITDERLVLGVAGVVELAAGLEDEIARLPRPARTAVVEIGPVAAGSAEGDGAGGSGTGPDPVPGEAVSGAGVAVPSSVSDSAVDRATGGLRSGHRYWGGNRGSGDVIGNLRGVVAALTGAPGKGLLSRIGSGVRKLAGAEPIPQTDADWSTVIGGLGALAFRASVMTTDPEDRTALAGLLAAVADTPLADQAGHWRTLRLTPPDDEWEDYGAILPTAGGQAFAQDRSSEWSGGEYRSVLNAVEYVAEAGKFGAVRGYSILGAREGAGWSGAGRIRETLGLLATRGPAPWRPEAVAELSSATGITRAEAALLLSGLVRVDAYETNFLPGPVRELLGLKVAEAKTARDSLAGVLGGDERLRLLSLAMPERPADLWEHGPDVARLAEGWNELVGRRVPVPDTLVAEFARARRNTWTGARDASAVLQGMVAPRSTAWLTTDLRHRVEGQTLKSGPGDGFRPSHLADTVIGLFWLAYRLPLGDPIRAVLPSVHDALRERLANPDLLLPFVRGEDLNALRLAYGLPPAASTPGAPTEVLPLGEAGYLVASAWVSELYVRPAALGDGDDPILDAAVVSPGGSAAALIAARGPDLAGLVEELRAEAGGGVGWAQDPLVSVPGLVTEAAERFGLDPDAARLYLQLLALPDPTDRNVRLWNGWAPRTLKAATAALLASGLVVEGQRARAGRSVFLPSAWLTVKAPGVPLEAWKTTLLGLGDDGRSPLDLAVPVTSVRVLYTRAWERVRAGDGPRLQTLRTR